MKATAFEFRHPRLTLLSIIAGASVAKVVDSERIQGTSVSFEVPEWPTNKRFLLVLL
jgi:hypothetical protein